MNVHHAEPFRVARARSAFKDFLGNEAEATRATAIEQLPMVHWKGRTLRTIRCHGVSGKGPHDVNVPESLPWTLIDIRRFLCPFHANDAWSRYQQERGKG